MLLLEGNGIKKYFGNRLIINLENLKIYTRDRIGLVGANGSGKTTLLRLLSKRLEPDEGWVRLYEEYSYISQLEPPKNRRISPESASKLNIPEQWHQNMSGGEQTRFKFAQCVDHNNPLIFADEPTSNMDLEGMEEMEDWFHHFAGGAVLVSHDRSFLDRICNKILEIENGKLTLYKGNYSEYRKQKNLERQREKFEYEEYIKEKKRLEGVITDLSGKSHATRKAPRRMGNSEARLHKMGNQKAKASLDKSTKSIQSRIDQLEKKDKPVKSRKLKFDLEQGTEVHSKIILQGEGITKAFGEKVLFEKGEFQLYNGSKVALIGPNGSGKTTLLNMIIHRETGIHIAPGAKVGYFSQNLNNLTEDQSILKNVTASSIYPENIVRTLLARLLFTKEAVHKPVKLLSGGERVKVSLAKMLMEDLNLLIMDEPTNYLDIPSIEAVEEALVHYEQTLLFVSHDRRLIRSVAKGIMTIENNSINVFQGDYDAFLEKKNRPEDKESKKREEEIIVLQNRLSEVIGKLSIPSEEAEKETLEQEYEKTLRELKKLKA